MCIVNDGGDPDAVDRVVADLASDVRHRVAVLHNRESIGRSAAANSAIRRLTTEFVVLHDDDDYWDRSFLSATVAYLDAHPRDIGVMVRTEIVYEKQVGDAFRETGRVPFWPALTEISYSEMLQVNRAVPISYLYRRSLHDALGYYREDLHAVEDWEFNLRALAGHSIGFLNGPPLAFWTQRLGVSGELGNSMFTLAGEHDRYDRLVRDEALRAYVRDHGAGLPLFLTRYIQDEVSRQLDARRGLSEHLIARVRRWRDRRRTR